MAAGPVNAPRARGAIVVGVPQVSGDGVRPTMDGEVVHITQERSCSARLPNEILVVFSEPPGEVLRVGDRLRILDLRLDAEVQIVNVTQDRRFAIHVASNNVHDLRLQARHGGSRTPTLERLLGP